MVTLRFRIRQESLISAKFHRDSEGRVCLNAIESVSLLKDIVTLIPISAIGVTFSKFDGPINIHKKINKLATDGKNFPLLSDVS